MHSIDYRLAPEHAFPAAVEDALTAVRRDRGRRQVVVAGDSAGGNLAAVCARRNDVPSIGICGQLLVYPVLDTDMTRPSYLRNDGLVLGPRRDDLVLRPLPARGRRSRLAPAAPLRAGTCAASPPAVIAVAGYDPLYDEGVAYAEALRAARVRVTMLDFPALGARLPALHRSGPGRG